MRMKNRRLSSLVAAVLALAMLLGSVPALALAVDPSITNVKQSGDLSSFAKDAPLVSILIDESMLTDTKEMHASVEFLQQEKYPGFMLHEADASITFEADDNIIYNIEDYVIYDQNVDGAQKLSSDAGNFDANFFEGAIYKVTFKDAAILPGEGRGDVVMTVSNVHIALQTNLKVDFDGFVYLTKGNLLRGGNTATPETTSSTTRSGVQLDVNFQVVYSGTDTPVPGSFFYPIKDIDVDRRRNSNFGKLDNAGNVNNYSEQVQVNATHTSDIYVVDRSVGEAREASYIEPNPNPYETKEWDYLLNVSRTSAGTLFAPQSPAYDTKDPGNFLTGFATVADNSKGIDITAWTAGSKTAPVRTSLLGGGNFHTIVSSTTGGGNIQTTQSGNADGKLSGGDVLGPGSVEVPDGKTVRYTMTPDEGFEIGHIRIGDEIDGSKNGVTVTKEELAALISGTAKDIPLADGRTGRLEYDSEQGAYIFTFPENNYDHKIHVSWVTSLKLTKKIADSDSSFRFLITLSELEDGEYALDKIGAPDAADKNAITVSGGSGSLEVQLKNDEYVIVKGLTPGTKYAIGELIPPGGDSYTVKYAITAGSDTLVAETTDSSTGEQTLTKPNPEIVFTNTYVPPAGAKATLSGTKTYADADGAAKAIEAGQFKVKITADPDNFNSVGAYTGFTEIQQDITADGKWSSEEVSFSKVGTYKFYISEVKGDASGITYDETGYYAIVTVKNNTETNKLTAEVEYYKTADNSKVDAVEFKNVYTETPPTPDPEPAKLTLRGVKTLKSTETGSDIAMAAGQFRVTIASDAANDATGYTGFEPATVDIAANGVFSFSEITFTKAGTYKFTVTEENLGARLYTYDTLPVTVTVDVTLDTAENKLTASVAYTKNGAAAGEISFANTYTPPAIPPEPTEPTPVTVTLRGVKTLKNAQTGDAAAFAAGQFRVTIDADPANSRSGYRWFSAGSKDIAADGAFSFDEILFVREGIYRFVITEENLGAEGYVYDDTVITAEIEVSLDRGRNMLVAAVAYKADGNTVSGLSFENTLVPSSTSDTSGSSDTEENDPREPTEPTNPITPDEPKDPTEPVTPAEPTEPQEPTEPSDPQEPQEPTEPVTPVTPVSHDTPAAPNAPAKDTSATPKTGDSGIGLWIALLIASLAMLIVTSAALIRTKRKGVR